MNELKMTDVEMSAAPSSSSTTSFIPINTSSLPPLTLEINSHISNSSAALPSGNSIPASLTSPPFPSEEQEFQQNQPYPPFSRPNSHQSHHHSSSFHSPAGAGGEPKIENELEFIIDRYHPDFGTPQLKQRKKDLVLINPELYCPYPHSLHTEKYNWEVFETGSLHHPHPLHGGSSQFIGNGYGYLQNPYDDPNPLTRPSSVPDNIRFPKEIPEDEYFPNRPKTSSDKIIISNIILPKFEMKRLEMLKAGKILKKANEKLGGGRKLHLLNPLSKEDQEKAAAIAAATLPNQIHDDTFSISKNPLLAAQYQHATQLKKKLRLGVDNIPVLKKPYVYQPEEIMKAFNARTFQPESVLNIWQDSEVPLSKEKNVTIEHIETCVYRTTRKYGYVFEDKEKIRKEKYSHLMKIKRIPKRHSILRKSINSIQKPVLVKQPSSILIAQELGLSTPQSPKSPVSSLKELNVEIVVGNDNLKSPSREESLLLETSRPSSSEKRKTESPPNDIQSEESPSKKPILSLQSPFLSQLSHNSLFSNEPSPFPGTPKSALKKGLSRGASMKKVSIATYANEHDPPSYPEEHFPDPSFPMKKAESRIFVALPPQQEEATTTESSSIAPTVLSPKQLEELELEQIRNASQAIQGFLGRPQPSSRDSQSSLRDSPSRQKSPSVPRAPPLVFSRPSTAGSTIPSEPLSARTPRKENPLIQIEPFNIENIKQSLSQEAFGERLGDLNLFDYPFKSVTASGISVTLKSLDREEDLENASINKQSLQLSNDDLSKNRFSPYHTELQRKLTPVAFSFNQEGMINDIHYQSQLPKKRPTSADRQTMGSRQSNQFNLLSSPSKLIRFEEFMKAQQDTLQQDNPVLNDAFPQDYPNVSTISKPFMPHYLRMDKNRKPNSHRKDLNNLVFIDPEDRRKERAGLMSLYDMCSGDEWFRHDNWGSTLDVREWYGVGVNVEGYVFEINLANNNLKGKFPDNLVDFPRLEVLNLDHNQLYGPLPDYALQMCDNLRILCASYNQLDGNIPFNLLTDCLKLKEIWLNDNFFTGPIEDGLYELISLTHLCLDNNQLTGPISPKISKLQNLIYLSLGRNKLSGVIPQSIVGLQDLELLSLHTNQFEGKVPLWIDIIPKLDELRLYNNPNLINDLKDRETVKSAVKKKFIN